MHFHRTSITVGAALFILGLVGFLVISATAQAGFIQPPLDEMIAKSDLDEKISAIIIRADRVDNEKLNQSLKARKATFGQRHYEVITTLQQKATLTQGPVIQLLNELQSRGMAAKIKSFWISNMIHFEGTAEAIKEVAALNAVEKIVFNFPVETIKPVKTDSPPPVISTHSQGLDVINAPLVWEMGFAGAGRLVSNIDTGVDGTHPALSPRWRGNNGHPASECWFDPVDGTTTPTDHGSHGTHTMGTICGRSSTTYDTVGVAIDAQWIACASVDYGGTTADIIASFQFIADPDGTPSTTDDVPDVVGNSWGYSPFFHGVPHCDDTFWSVMDGCENAGVAVIFSAGNEGDYYGPDTPNSLRTPADRATTYYNAFSVGAIDGHIAGYPIAGFSSRGPCDCATDNRKIKPECVAPGVTVRSSVPGGGYESAGWSGTSMASPHISGSVAILRQIDPNLEVDEIKNILLQSCVDLGPTGEDNTYGHGVLDLYQAVQLVLGDIGYIEGYVRETAYSTGLPAKVQIFGSSISTTANSSGYYVLTAPGDTTYTVRATYHGYVPDEQQVTVTAGDTTSQDFSLIPPLIDYSPVSYNVSVPPGQSTSRDLIIKNIGAGIIYFTLTTETYSLLTLDEGKEIPIRINKTMPMPLGYKPADNSKAGSVAEPYYPPMILGQGGPDKYGHIWIDSDDPGGPPLTWVDISSQGTSVSLGEDDFVGPISIGFSFPFYDNNYSSLYICSNGILTFGNGSDEWVNVNIPNSTDPDNFIAPWWDDLSPDDGGTVKYYYDSASSRFIVSYMGVPNYVWYGGTGSLTFQAILYSSGKIEFNYGTMDPGSDDLVSATIGIEDYNANDGLPIVYNASYMHNNLSIIISAGSDWLSAEPPSDSIMAGDSLIATVTFDATNLTEGVYTGNVNLDNNEPINNEIDIPVTLNVTDVPAPSIDLNVMEIYDTVYSGYSTTFDLIVGNTGTLDLTYNTTDNRTWISENPDNGTVPPSQSDTVAVTFNATSLSPGNYTGTLTVNSNDPIHSTINIPCNLFVDLLITDDVGISEIINPPDSMINGTAYAIEVEVNNYGIDPQTFDAVFETYFYGSSTVEFADTLTITNMPPSSSETKTFTESFIPTVDTTYTFVAYTTLPGDQVPGNNSASRTGRSYTMLNLWYGRLDSAPIDAPISEMVGVDVYIQTPPGAYIADLHLCLGTDDQYIDSLMSIDNGQYYYPLTEWDLAEFQTPHGSPPNRSGWSSQSLIGWARIIPESESPWLHYETPTKIATFAIRVINNTDLIGATRPAIGEGLNQYQGPSNAGDTTGDFGYPLIEQFSQLHFIESLANSVQVFYGNLDSSPIAAPINGRVYVKAYIQTPEGGYIADLHLCLGAANQYIDSLLSETEGQVYYPLSEWDVAEFCTPHGSPPNPAGWTSQSFIGWARIYPESTSPWLYSETPLKIMAFVLKTVDNPDLVGDTVMAIGYGLNLYQGPSNAGDTSGNFSYPVIEYFSELFFTETMGCDYLPGDVNGDKSLIGSDVTYGVRYFAENGPPPPDSCYNASTSNWLYSAADANGSCEFIGSDITYLIAYFRGNNPPPTWCPDTPPLNPPLMIDGLNIGFQIIPGE